MISFLPKPFRCVSRITGSAALVAVIIISEAAIN
jgi:hypothetical protein